MLKELVDIIDAPYKSAKAYVDKAYAVEKQQKIMKYARDKAVSLGEMGERIVNSPAFYNEKWNLKGSKDKAIQDEIDGIFTNGVLVCTNCGAELEIEDDEIKEFDGKYIERDMGE